MENPFVYGKIVRGEAFADRDAEIDELTRDIATSQNVILFSPRRYGKSSLILEVLDRVGNEGVLSLYLDLFKVISEEGFISAYAREVARLQTGGMQSVLRTLRELLPRLVPKVALRDERSGLSIEFEFDPRGVRAPLLDDLFEAVARVAAKAGRRAVVALDEFQEITTWDKEGAVERQMRTHFQLHDNVSYVFMGSKRHLMEEIFRNRNRPFYRFGKHFPLEKIPRDAFGRFIRERFGKGGIVASDPAIASILDVTEDHPYYTQLLCHILWNRAGEMKSLTSDDVDRAVEEVFSREAHAFHDQWDGLPLGARQVLAALAKEEGDQLQLYSSDFLQKHNLGSASSVQRAVSRLIAEEVLERHGGEYLFNDVFFKRWIVREFA